jgi:aspartyl aminopeptidase
MCRPQMPDPIAAFLSFLDASPSPYHVVQECERILGAAGFSRLYESQRWAVQRGGAYYVVRGGKTIVAWRQGHRPVSENGYRILAAHSDSPVLKLRPNAALTGRGGGYLTTEIYGSPLLHTWLDRDLSVAGAVHYEDQTGALKSAIVDLKDLRLRTLSLAPHLRSDKKFDSVAIDRHKDLPVIVSTDANDAATALAASIARHVPGFKTLVSMDSYLHDTIPATLVGAKSDLISAPRLDNLFCAFSAATALADCGADLSQTTMAAIYDAEEIGSDVWTGARSNIVDTILTRIAAIDGDGADSDARARACSVILSADMAHAEHVSFPDATDSGHAPHLNQGIVVKSGARGNYAIGPEANAWFRHLCARHDLKLQTFMYRCDHGAGSSVGPYITTALGIPGLDIGAPMLAMHSIRELAGRDDLAALIKAMGLGFAAPLVSDPH